MRAALFALVLAGAVADLRCTPVVDDSGGWRPIPDMPSDPARFRVRGTLVEVESTDPGEALLLAAVGLDAQALPELSVTLSQPGDAAVQTGAKLVDLAPERLVYGFDKVALELSPGSQRHLVQVATSRGPTGGFAFIAQPTGGTR